VALLAAAGLAWLGRSPPQDDGDRGGLLFLTLPTLSRAAKLGAKYVTTEGTKAWAPDEWAKKIVNLSLRK
jgi:hypothetical protein